jgi:Chlorophyll A-B binding protein
MMLRTLVVALLAASASAFTSSSSSSVRPATLLHAEEMSKSIPFLVRPEKLDGSMAGDMGFDPMRLSDIQTDLKYARWAELKHGRIAVRMNCHKVLKNAFAVWLMLLLL